MPPPGKQQLHGLAALAAKLTSHWTPISFKLYLRHEVPFPLPAVGPLAELLNVTRAVASEASALAAGGGIAPSDVAAVLDGSAIKVLCQLAQWLQAPPQELLLNSETTPSLWQLLLATLAALLRAAAPDAAVAGRFRAVVAASGLLGGLATSLSWLQQQHPQRCLTASAGAWLLLQELLGSSSSSIGGRPEAGDAAAATGGAELLAQQLPQLGQLLQSYVDTAYENLAHPPQLPAATPSRTATAAAKKGLARQDSSSGGTCVGSDPGAAAATAAPQASHAAPGTPQAAAAAGGGGNGSRTGSEAGADGWRFSHPVCLIDDPAGPVFSQLLVLLHGLQAQLLVAAAAAGAGGAAAGDSAAAAAAGDAAAEVPRLQLPVKSCLQVLAFANTWLQSRLGDECTGGAAAGGADIPQEHLLLLPNRDVALAAAAALGIAEPAAALQLTCAACNALQLASASSSGDSSSTAASSNGGSADAAAAGSAAASANSSSSASSGSSEEGELAFKLQLQSVALLQASGLCGAPAGLLEQLAGSARRCSRQQLEALVAARGRLLLQVLARYLNPPLLAQQHLQQQQQQQQQQQLDEQAAAAAARAGRVSDASDGGGELGAEVDEEAAGRCVLVAQIMIGLTPGRLMGVARGFAGQQEEDADDQMLGRLTETDPAAYYGIMDHLVRHVAPDNLLVLLPMAAAFLARSLGGSSAGGSGEQAAAAEPGGDDAAAEAAAAAKRRSMVLLSDTAVCRSFAAALHGYCKSVVAPVAAGGGSSRGGGANGHHANGCSDADCGLPHAHGAQQHQQQHVLFVLPPLRKVAEWLVAALDDAITTAAAAQQAAEAAAGSGGSEQQQQPAAAQLVATVQGASRAAACSLSLVVLLSRAVVPVLTALQQQLGQLQAAQQASGSGGASSAAVVVPEPVALDLLSGLMFTRAVYQALLARMYLSQVISRLPDSLALLAAATTAAAAVGGAGGEQQQAQQQALRSAGAAVRVALRGGGLARGWGHLVAQLPSGVAARVASFQSSWPGDWVEGLDLLGQLTPLAQQQQQQQQQPSAGAADGSSEPQQASVAGLLALPAGVRNQLACLLADLAALLEPLLNELPMPVGCNNPGCTNVAGIAEASLGCNKRCSECWSAHYCSKACQTEHWPVHKLACKRIRPAHA